MKRIKQSSLVILGLVITIGVTKIHAFTLEDAIEETIRTNPVVIERKKNYNISVQDVKKAYSEWYPTLDWHSWIGKDISDNRDTNTKTDEMAQSHQLVLNYNLFNGFGTQTQINEQKTKLRSAAYSYLEKVNDTAFNVTRAYIEVLRDHALFEVEQNNVEMHEKYYQDMKMIEMQVES